MAMSHQKAIRSNVLTSGHATKHLHFEKQVHQMDLPTPTASKQQRTCGMDAQNSILVSRLTKF
jgi:hypothetical protein